MEIEGTYEQLLVLLRVSRVPGWCFGPILYTIGMIHSRTLPNSLPEFLYTGFRIFCLCFPLCIIVFGVNDVYDYFSDLRNPRKQGQSLEGGILNPRHHELVLSAARLSSAFILLSSFFNPSSVSGLIVSSHWNLSQTLVTILVLILSWQYSSPPLRLKEKPILDSLSNGAIVWLCWALGYTSSGSALFGADVGEGASKGWLLAFCTAGIHALGAAADMEADIAADQRTIATVFGKQAAAGFSAILFFIASKTVDSVSIVGVYSFLGTITSLIPVFKPSWTHKTFKALVYVSILGASWWIGERASRFILNERSP